MKIEEFYTFTDKVVGMLLQFLIREFNGLKTILHFDEINVLNSVNTLNEKVLKRIEADYLKIALNSYNRAGGKTPEHITEEWLIEFLETYDPVTGYVFFPEAERKKAHLIEGLIADDDKNKVVKTNLRYYSQMVKQYGDEVTDKATLQAYIDNGVTEVKWVATIDDKTCEICRKRNGKVFPISKIPSKPHYNCRCVIIPYTKGDK